MLFQKSMKFIFPMLLGIIATFNQTPLAANQSLPVSNLIVRNDSTSYNISVEYTEWKPMGLQVPPTRTNELSYLRPGDQRRIGWPQNLTGIILSFAKQGEQPKNKSDTIQLEIGKTINKKPIIFKDAAFELSVTWPEFWTNSGNRFNCEITITDKK